MRQIADRVLEDSTAEQIEVIVTHGETNLTRFASSAVHQNVAETNVQVRVRAIVANKTGVASGNDTSDEGLSRLVGMALDAARFQKEDPVPTVLPDPSRYAEVDSFSEATAAATPEDRVLGVIRILEQARAAELKAAGAYSTATEELLIANSHGLRAFYRGTDASLMAVVTGETGSGYAGAVSHEISEIDPAAVGAVAADKARRSAHPTSVDPGEYTVILEETAVSDMVRTLAMMGLGALALQEKRSFMTGRLGERITGERVTIWDDGLDPAGFPRPFDFEGTPKQKVMLIDHGVACGVVYDTATAAREPGGRSTGHALPSPNSMGPLPTNLFMATGTSSIEEMVASTERGIYVTRFHYTNPLHPVQTVFTGMTRDGTFLVEHGKVTRPIANLRFTQNILEAFANADLIGSEAKAARAFGLMANSVPAIRTHGFRFTGTTEF